MNEFEDLLNSVSQVEPGDVVTAEVLTVDANQANVAIAGTGVEGVLTLRELTNDRDADINDFVKPGDTLERGLLRAAVVVDQGHGGQAKEVQQVHPDTQTHEVGDEYQPAVATLIVTALVPLEDQPKDYGREERAEGIDLSLYGAEPEGVREGVHEATHEPCP